MRARSNRSGAAHWLGAALASLLVAACGGHAQPRAEEEPVVGEAPPAPDDEGASESPVNASSDPVVSLGEPSAVDTGEAQPAASRLPCPWVSRRAMPEGGRLGMGFAALGGQVFLFGGMSQAQLEQAPGGAAPQLSALDVYEPATDEWSRRGDMPIDSGDVSAAAVGGYIYVFAGMGSGGFISRGYRYDTQADSWLERAPLRIHRSNFSTAVVGSKVYLIGGSGQVDDGVSTSGEWVSKAGLEIYDTATDQWTEGAPAPGAVNGAASCVLGERIFVFDGTVSGATYIYDTSTNRWSEGARAPQARHLASCVADDDLLLLIGGRTPLGYENEPAVPGDSSANPTIESSTLIQAYAPALDSWQDGGRLPRARERFAAATIDEEVYVIGGAESHTTEGPQGTFVLDEVTAMTNAFCEVR